MNKAIRVRFAPSPTGYLHIGSLRTALFNWLFARHHKGTFLVRIEDTDNERSKVEYTQSMIKDLSWMHLESDELIIHQSDRFDYYTSLIQTLIDQGKAYKDYYTQDEVTALYQAKTGSAEFVKAYLVCRDQPQQQHKPYVVRFKLPFEQQTNVAFNDQIRGHVSFDLHELDDFVIARSDGRAIYNFVVVADDIDQRITHIIRGEDHIPNTPKQILLYQALGKQIPFFAHLPLILGKDGQRLSKRDAATAVQEYKELGYLPEALLNYLVRLGWSHGDQEVFSRDELVQLFDIEHVGKKAAIFDQDKLDWLNALYLRSTDNQSIYTMLTALHLDYGQDVFTQQQILALIALYKERSKTLVELAQLLKSIACAPTEYDETAYKQSVTQQTVCILQDIISRLEQPQLFTLSEIKQTISLYAKEKENKLGIIAQPIRIALVGSSSSPGIFELLEIVGKKESVVRLQKFIDYIKQRAL